MGKYDDAMYAYLSDNAKFADLFNGAVFHGKEVLQADMLEDAGQRYAAQELKAGEGKRFHSGNRFRDLCKKISNGVSFVVVAVENQASVDYIMPWRIMQYDQLEYGRQIKAIKSRKAQELLRQGRKPGKWNTKIERSDKLHPVYTICFYHGTEKWDGPKNLADMMDFGEDSKSWRMLFQDYRMTLVCADELKDMSLFHTDLKLLLQVLALRGNKEGMHRLLQQEPFFHISADTARTIAVMTDNMEILDKLDDCGEGGVNMCRAMDELKKDWKTEGLKEGIKAMVSACHELNVPYADVRGKIKEKFRLSEDETENYMSLYW